MDLTTTLLLTGLAALNLTTFILMGTDKAAAAHSQQRIPEKIFYTLSIAGGVWGTILGITTFHHKTKKPEFYIPIGLIALLHLALLQPLIPHIIELLRELIKLPRPFEG